MAVLLGLLVALGYGAGDFLGGLASRRTPTPAVLLTSQALGLAVALVVVAATGGPVPDTNGVLASIAAGALGAGGLGLLYHGLPTSGMGLVAPLAAVVSAVLPVTVGLATGERPSSLALGGCAVAMAAVAVIASPGAHPEPVAHHAGEAAQPPQRSARRRGILLGCGAGLLFGTTVPLLSVPATTTGLWPVALARAGALTAVGTVVLIGRRPVRVGRPDLPATAAAGGLDVAATVVLLLAVRRTDMSLLAPAAALAPAFTVLLARLVLAEPVGRRRVAGLVVALAGLALAAVPG